MPYRAVPTRRTQPQNKQRKRILLLAVAGFAVLFIIVNVVLGLIFADKTYPGWRVAGKPFGNVSYSQLSSSLGELQLLPDEVALQYKQTTVDSAPATLGVAVDTALLQMTIKQRHWLPLANLVLPRDMPLSLRVDNAMLGKRLAVIGDANKETPVDGRIVQKSDGFELVRAVNGSMLDNVSSQQAVLAGLRTGKDSVALVVRSVPPPVTDASLAEPLRKLKAAVATQVSYSYRGEKITAASADVTGWYRPDAKVAGGFALSEPTLRSFITAAARQSGIRASNVAAAVSATRQALEGGKELNFTLEGSPIAAAKTFKYCTAVRGVDAARLPELQKKALETFADERGWGLNGAVDYQSVTTDCDFTIWLSSANQMASFGAICDSEWSCMVSPNVVINVDRWDGASDTWNKAGLYLADYRNMVINHETGHWLGFGHTYCPGAGQAAPVMQQQSISLQGCVFNPWPTTGEMGQLKGRLGL